VTIPGERT